MMFYLPSSISLINDSALYLAMQLLFFNTNITKASGVKNRGRDEFYYFYLYYLHYFYYEILQTQN